MDDHNIAPINPLPWVVWLLVLPMIGLEVLFALAEAGAIGGPTAIGWRLSAMQDFGFIPEYWRQQALHGAFDLELLRRFFTYSFIHGDVTMVAFGVVICLALGKFVAEVFQPWAVVLVFVGGAAMGALVYGYFVPQQVLIGAFPGVYGLIGAYSFLLWVGLSEGENPLRAFRLIGGLLAIQVLYGAVFTVLPMVFPSMGETQGDWSWVADIAGFAAGFVLSFVVSPGGFGRVMGKMRQR